MELWSQLFQLDQKFPGLTKYLYLVSCEENIETIEYYASLGDRIDSVASSLEKEHVLLALRFEIGNRSGILLCDPGYHVGRVVTVMSDHLYPHTGWFVQSKESHSRKEYNYTFSAASGNFVEWTELVTNANGIQTKHVALIYITRPFLTAIDVTERRNLAYNFRSLLARNPKGHLKAGIYFKVKLNYDEFTIFYEDGGNKKRIKLNMGTFLYPERVEEGLIKVVRECSIQLNLAENALESILASLALVFSDRNYIKQLLEINDDINNMFEDN